MMSEITRTAIQAPIAVAMASEMSRSQFHTVAQDLLRDFDRVTAENAALQQRLNAADERADVLEGLLRLARGAIGENQWTLLTKDIDALLPQDAQRTNNSGSAHCPRDGICHTSEETCAEAQARIASLTAPAGAGQ